MVLDSPWKTPESYKTSNNRSFYEWFTLASGIKKWFNFGLRFFLEFRTLFLNLDRTLDKNSCPKKKLGGTFFRKKRKKLLEPVGDPRFFSRKN